MATSLGSPGKDLKRSKYRLLGLVGQGQFGRVYCAVHRRTGQLVALKDLDHDRFPTHKFLRELRFLLSLEHPNIVTCRALEHTRTGRYLVMDYCEGGTLRGLMKEETRLSLPQCIKLTMDILAGLEQAHSRGIVHCDIKPENILLNLEPHGWKARVSDFGIARVNQELAEPQSGSGNTGSPAYMAPERFYGQYSKSSDLYSVGILLYELMAGDRPYSGTPGELMSAHLNQSLRFPESIPAVWHPVITTALQKLAARRFHTATAMLQALKQAAESAGILEYITVQPVTMPLLQPMGTVSISDLRETPAGRIGQAMQAIAPWPDDHSRKLIKPFPEQLHLCYGWGDRVVLGQWQTKLGDRPQTPATVQSLPLNGTVQQLIPHAQGCYAVTSQAVYGLTQLDATDLGVPKLTATPLATTSADAAVTFAPAGQWMAIAHQAPQAPIWTLQVQPLHRGVPHPQLPAKTTAFRLPAAQTQLLNAIALDRRHLVVAFQNPDASSKSANATWLDVVTRRGTRMTRLAVPVQINQICPTAVPYRLIATDCKDPQSLIALDLKPYRIARFGLGMTPHLIAAAPWGYLLADANGQVLMLDEYGQRVGRLDLPFSPTAMIPFTPSGLLIATWNETWGQLHILNLKNLEIDLLF